jgi:hypothetical protein
MAKNTDPNGSKTTLGKIDRMHPTVAQNAMFL